MAIPMRRRLRILAVLAVSTALGLAAAAATARHYSHENREYTHYAPSPLDDRARAALAHRYGADVERIRTTDGLTIPGIVLEPTDRAAPYLVYFAGNGSDQEAAGLDFLAAVDPDRRAGWAIFPMRGFDSAPGHPNLAAMHNDARALLGYLGTTHHVASSRVHVIGFSLGTDVAIHLAASRPEPASLVLLAPWVEPYCELAEGRFHRYLPARDCSDPRSLLPSIHVPTLVVHGARDEIHPLGQGREVASTVADARIVILDRAGHLEATTDDRARAAVREFIFDRR